MKKKILVVDDNLVILTFMTSLLEKEGHQVKTAEDGLSALDILRTYIPDVMFIDLIMPNINGEQLCRIIRKMPELKDTYAVILSATIAEKSRDFTELDADAFIVKGPFNEMAKHVIAVIEQSDQYIPKGDLKEIMGFKGIHRRQITKELISAKEHLEAILRNISDAIMELAPEGRIIFANPAAVSLTGLSEEELLGSRFTELINEGDRKRIEDFLIRIDEGSHKVDLDTPVLINSRPISLRMLPVKEDVSSSAMLVLNDITEAIQAEAIVKREHGELERRVRERTIELAKTNKQLEEEIHNRTSAEKVLKTSQQRLSQIINFLPDATMVIDLEGKVIAWNRATEDMTGIKAQEMLGKGDYEYSIPFYGERRPVLIDIVGQWNKEMEEKYQYIKKEGESLVAETYDSLVKPGGFLWNKASLLYDQNGEVIGAIASIRDITDRKVAEEALRKNEEQLRTIIEHSNEMFYIHDTEHTFTYVSQTSEDLLGYTPEEMMINWTELATDNPINEQGLEITEKGIDSGERQPPYILEIKKKDGTSVLLEIDESPVKDATGKVVAISGAARDVTDQKRTEQRLLKSEKGFRDLFNSITDLIYTQDLDGRFISVNPAMSTVFGYERDALIGRPASDFMMPEMRPFFKRQYLEQIKTKGSHEGVTSYFAKNGEKIYIDYRSSLVDPDDGEPYISGTGRDVTERVLSQREIKRLQKQILQSQKMEAIGLMAGGVAHDLNNILSGMVSYPELLLMDLPEDSPLRKPIKTIQESGMRAADVVEDLLTIARGVATGKEALNLNTLITEYLESPEYQTLDNTHSFVNLKTELDPDLLNLSGSPTHIKKTLMNLTVNASEAIEGSGTVTISTMNRYLDEPLKGYEDVRAGEYAVLSVSDNGSGISPEDLERIFEPFYTKKVMGRSGTGLGLAVVWNTIQDHDGYIDVKSSKKGTVFELYFPATREEVATEKEDVPLEDYLGHGERILVVDDEARQREIASGMLTKLGYAAEVVSSGEEAIEYVKKQAVDLIVLDMVMPKGINGRETYEQIIKIRPGQKAIIASGYAKTREVETAQKLGAGKYIKKPYILEKIGLAVKEELEK